MEGRGGEGRGVEWRGGEGMHIKWHGNLYAHDIWHKGRGGGGCFFVFLFFLPQHKH